MSWRRFVPTNSGTGDYGPFWGTSASSSDHGDPSIESQHFGEIFFVEKKSKISTLKTTKKI